MLSTILPPHIPTVDEVLRRVSEQSIPFTEMDVNNRRSIRFTGHWYSFDSHRIDEMHRRVEECLGLPKGFLRN